MADSALARPSFPEALRFWLKLGFISFGGPTGQIAIMHDELVERLRWIDERRFLHALNYCMLLPGPEAQQLATYVGWLLHGTRGGIAAGVLFVLPSVFILLALSWIYMAHGSVPWVAAVFAGLQPAVVAIVAHAAIRIAKRALKHAAMVALAALAFVAIYFFDVPFPAIVLGAGLVGFAGARLAPRVFAAASSHGGDESTAVESGPPPSWRRALTVLAICGFLWWAPVALAGFALGWDSLLVQQGTFFSKAAMVTFGGAYSVLPYVGQAAVERYGWLTAQDMSAGLALAETTPGPLIMVLQFVGFVAGWRASEPFTPGVGGVLSALMVTWVTFLPCFLWIFLGAPHVERLRSRRRLGAALSAITAAVVGVVLNLGVWLALQVFAPPERPIDVAAVLFAAAAFAAMQFFRVSVPWIVGAGALFGLLSAAS